MTGVRVWDDAYPKFLFLFLVILSSTIVDQRKEDRKKVKFITTFISSNPRLHTLTDWHRSLSKVSCKSSSPSVYQSSKCSFILNFFSLSLLPSPPLKYSSFRKLHSVYSLHKGLSQLCNLHWLRILLPPPTYLGLSEDLDTDTYENLRHDLNKKWTIPTPVSQLVDLEEWKTQS